MFDLKHVSSAVKFSETTGSVREAGVSVLLEPATPVVICKILFVETVLRVVVNKGEQILSSDIEYPRRTLHQ